ncbi:hypothetical protein ETAA8_44000 [Anatilimnocola aggregata]|uniref:Uncharacterized protein n=1 Tax=Anatilimnocola aggregata TaxID=2528021 RepID=A0A517YGH5_9BACT|nr:hypothetical protein [Anatilimnocola aggregata]QDU29292.1 hypothetical protein ETAA8_44000 [Anatilimnocola aggregata]
MKCPASNSLLLINETHELVDSHGGEENSLHVPSLDQLDLSP